MKLKNVLAGLKKEYDIEELNIITPTKVLFSAPIEKWDNMDFYYLRLKKKVEEAEITNRMIFNSRKAFLFVPEIEL